MNFPLNKEDKLNGLIRSFVDKKYPKVELYASSQTSNAAADIFSYNDENAHWCSLESEGLSAQLVVKIVNAPFYITHYSIRSHFTSVNYMQAWSFEASKDNAVYETLDNRSINDDLSSSGIGQYRINTKKKGFQYFKIKQTVPTKEAHTNMRISGLDFFGSFIPACKLCTCKNRGNERSILLLYLLFEVS